MEIVDKLFRKEEDLNLLAQHKDADKFMIQLMLFNWILVTTFGGYFFGTYVFGFVSGGLLFAVAYLFYKTYSGMPIFRIIIGILLPVYAMILVQQSFGRIEMHFHFFVLLAFLSYYKDLKPVTIASALIVLLICQPYIILRNYNF